MLDTETVISRIAETTRERRLRLAQYRATSWLHPKRKIALFVAAHPVSDWPVDEMALVAALLSGIGIMVLLVA